MKTIFEEAIILAKFQRKRTESILFFCFGIKFINYRMVLDKYLSCVIIESANKLKKMVKSNMTKIGFSLIYQINI